MEEKIKIIIADDNKGFCDILKKYFTQYEDVEILGIAYTDEDEIKQIEELKPEIVVTDLLRNHKYTGLEIIKDYSKKKDHPEFLVISADKKEDVINADLKIGGYIKKPFNNYDIIIQELRKIKLEITNEEKRKIAERESMLIHFNLFNKILNLFGINSKKKK